MGATCDDKLENIILSCFNSCREYNDNMQYSNDTLNKNIKFLIASQYENGLSAMYEPLKNSITVNINKLYSSYGVGNAHLVELVSHEIGHMSVSNFEIKEGKILVKCGFCIYEFDVECISDGTVTIFKRNSDAKQIGSLGLEEMLNYIETDEKTINGHAPEFLKQFDKYTERKLHYARRNSSLSEYYEIMEAKGISQEYAKFIIDILDRYYSDELSTTRKNMDDHLKKYF